MLAKREPDAGFARAAMWVLAPACLLGLSIALLAVGTVQSRESDPAAKARIAELQKELNEKLKQGADDAEIQRLFDAIEAVQRTEKAPAPKADPAPQPLPAPMAVPTPVPSPTPSETTPKKDPQKLVEPLPKELLDQYNKQIKEFDEMLQRTDDPAAKEAIKKSRDEFQKAFEKGLDNADGLKEKIREMQQEQRQQQQRQRDAFPFRNGRLQWDVGPMIMPDIEALNRQNQQMLRQLMQMQGGLRNNLFLAPGQPRLGVVVERPAEVVIEQLDLPRNSGITIVEVQANSVAEKAGFKPNDIVLELAGKPVPSEPVDFQEFIAGLKAEEKFDAVVLRKGKKEKMPAYSSLPNRKTRSRISPASAVTSDGSTSSLAPAETFPSFR
jgi:hypothetical protein